jgi:hypothetical protein
VGPLFPILLAVHIGLAYAMAAVIGVIRFLMATKPQF